ncbi:MULTISPECIES: PRTRC system ThiF family protein [Spirosoma]|uniref:THIF-type NAD/FAD binding fold domain-containing protein n=1 Tax=Spirosoma pollinicola TaxID=2057025 RepID=A0A2K8Z8U1_9BACT|nr:MULTISPECIES: PRTRC system ThiF family protein [Spirosoma]AUD06303.1 hypothetical protein CWM47_33355 [Spirosoma pollinicola]
METKKPLMHFTAGYLINPTNPVTVNLLGAGGTGSQMLMALAKMNYALKQLEHPGFQVNLWDGDTVSKANLGRQLFAEVELGFNKAVALVNRTNRFFGTNWKAVPEPYCINSLRKEYNALASANVFISCVDTVSSRMELANILRQIIEKREHHQDRPYYWMDFGNGRHTGQVILSTVGKLPQPTSKKYRTVEQLPFVTDEFKTLLEQADTSDDTPSCSLAEALSKQELFINPTLANIGSSLLWSLLRNGMTEHRGVFLNLHEFRTQPLKLN